MIAIALAASLAAAAPPPRACPDERPVHARSQERAQPRPLGDMPPADLYRAVLRRDGDCAIVEVRVDGAWTLRPAGAAASAPAEAKRRR